MVQAPVWAERQKRQHCHPGEVVRPRGQHIETSHGYRPTSSRRRLQTYFKPTRESDTRVVAELPRPDPLLVVTITDPFASTCLAG